MNNSRLLTLYQISDSLGFLEKKVLFLVNSKKNYSNPREVLEELRKKNKNYAYTTIMTILDKLYKKKYLERKKIGKTYFYYSKIKIADLKKQSLFFTVEKILKMEKSSNFISCFFYIIFFKPLIFFFNQPFIKGINMAVLSSFIGFFFINFIYQIQNNGFFSYIKLLLVEPSFLINYLFLNINYLGETFIDLFFIGFIFYLLRKIKKSYQLNI